MAASTTVFLQDACLKHRYVRNKDTSNIVERPERIRAVKTGLSAAIARLEELQPRANPSVAEHNAAEDLTAALQRMNLASNDAFEARSGVRVVKSSAAIDILHNAAVKYVHGDIDGDVYLENLKRWAAESISKIAEGGSEIPEGLNQGDLYLCSESLEAMQGALGTVCEAVDTVIAESSANAAPRTARSAFVAVRPPGHHCGEDTPSGFCFVNNVAVAAAHAHLKHGINRVLIFDIDLHHGNGTQSIVWQINEETYRKSQELEAQRRFAESAENDIKLPDAAGLQVFYGSIHDVLSYPCEDGVPALVQAASTSVHGPHGQYIENIHLQPYSTDEHFWDVLYPQRYSAIFQRAEQFVQETGGGGKDVLIFISCGFDACEHEYPSMSRHGRRVPVDFYHRFARDAMSFAQKYSQGRLVSVLEGGYSDRALSSGAMAHLLGLVDESRAKKVDKEWWNVHNLARLEKATKKRARGARPSAPGPGDEWLQRTQAIFASMTEGDTAIPVSLPPPSMTLRDRKSRTAATDAASTASGNTSTSAKKGAGARGKGTRSPRPPMEDSKTELSDPAIANTNDSPSKDGVSAKKLPRVILHVRSPPGPDT
ncbi:Arginase/deacetylase [Punctularia strigosozonata HHB-11173 SS5]|uniref:Arginase/deacetylase n=1 Tax=Punctularia strigosozonata (strain HHB-11173) TaxID=741275 RepID=UPI0004417AA2|nr:Arginase/deacetylase [Punctularia strigosozonata HHB-11173 SS5]EIN12906.1 Arginase/deacetylase [Punctularia strigosozonata HHB-11173 SS5]